MIDFDGDPRDGEEDYSAFQRSEPTNEAMAELKAKYAEREKVVAKLEEYKTIVERGEKYLREIDEQHIPTIMADKCGLTECKLDNGVKLTIKEDYYANIPSQSTISKLKDPQAKKEMQERHDMAMTWVFENCPDIAKRRFDIQFGNSEEDQKLADKFERDLAKRKRPVPVDRSCTVHPQTLNATIRELIEEGHQVPWDTLGIFAKKVVKITLPR